MVFFATKVDCVFLMWETLGIIYLRKLINPGILFIQVPLRCIATSGSLLAEWHEEGYKRHC